jgi:hypothetical protein
MTTLSSFSDAARPLPCEPWKFWASAGFGLAAMALWSAAQIAAGEALIGWLVASGDRTARELDGLTAHGLYISLLTIATAPAPLAAIALAVRLARCRFADYLALALPRRRDLIVGLLILAALLPFADLVSYLSGRPIAPEFVKEIYRTARDGGTLQLLLLLFALVGVAPVAEEILFRGFLLRGLAASRVGAVGGIALTSAGWAAMHTQYDWFFIGHILVLGVAFGWLRLRSGSTALTILLHAAVNLTALAQTAAIVEWLS